jgi:Na+/H+ antiporter NhaD/arsenite permease-like protein
MLWIIVIAIIATMGSLSYRAFSKESEANVSEFQKSTKGKILTALSVAGCVCFGVMVFAIMSGEFSNYFIFALFLGALIGTVSIFVLRSNMTK